MSVKTVFFCLLLATAALVAEASSRAACAAPEHRQFDFWLGDWVVSTPDGKTAGRNRIERRVDGCVLHERYETTNGYRGESFNAYDPGTGRWYQTWVDHRGGMLRLEGGLREGAMVMEGETRGVDGTATRQRITWTPLPGGQVRQHWESASTDGASWQTVFDGLYTPTSGPKAEPDAGVERSDEVG